MRARLHLISMPWSDPVSTPIQLGSLKAYIDGALSRRIRTRTYPAYLGIPLMFRGKNFIAFHDAYSGYGEELFFLLFMLRFGSPAQSGLLRRRIRPILKRFGPKSLARGRITPRLLSGLDRAMRAYLESRILPHVSRSEMNIVGFSLVYTQTFSSLFCARYLKARRPAARMMFLFGGDGVLSPVIRRVTRRHLQDDALCVRGEGELKLEAIARTVLGAPEGAVGPGFLEELASRVPDVQRLMGTEVNLWTGGPDPRGQVSDLKDLPPPDYDEYFREIRRATADRSAYLELKNSHAALLVGGSRGCRHRCRFCGMSRNWHGCRTNDPSTIVSDIAELRGRYGVDRITLADNCCDAWAGRYADEIIRTGVVNNITLQLRARHPESFWVKLSLAGLSGTQLGVESLSTPLLQVMGKGCTTLDNLRSLKWLKELDVATRSNLLTHHPGSGLPDIRETRRVLHLIPHLDPLSVSHFRLTRSSPLCEDLSEDEKDGLRPFFLRLRHGRFLYPHGLRRDAVACRGSGLEFAPPRSLRLAPPVSRAWTRFVDWYERQVNALVKNPCHLTVQRLAPGSLAVFDSRYGSRKEYVLDGKQAAIYEACHAGLTADEISRQAKCSRGVVAQMVNMMTANKLMIHVDGHFMSLALRPRNQLIIAYLTSGGRNSPIGFNADDAGMP